jgi:hypothetical protein
MPERERLLSAIAREQSLLASLEKDEARARVRLETLRADLGALDAAPSGTPPGAGEPRAPATASDKVALFRSLFRGRTDVFPRRWENGVTPQIVASVGAGIKARPCFPVLRAVTQSRMSDGAAVAPAARASPPTPPSRSPRDNPAAA